MRRLLNKSTGDAPGLPQTVVARALGLTLSQVTAIEESALLKLRVRRGGALLERFRQAVIDQRRALDRRIPNRPWNDIDAEEGERERRHL